MAASRSWNEVISPWYDKKHFGFVPSFHHRPPRTLEILKVRRVSLVY